MNHPPRCIRFRAKDAVAAEAVSCAGDIVVRSARESWAADFCAANPAPAWSGLFLVRAGTGWFTAGGSTWRLATGAVAVHRQGAARAFWCEPADPLEVQIVDLSGPGWATACERRLGLADGVVMLSRPHVLGDALDRIHDALRRRQPDAGLLAGHLLHAALIELQGDRIVGGAAVRVWRQARQLIAERATTLPTAAAVARILGVSPSYLARIFRLHDHRSVGAQLRRARLQACLEDLRQGVPACVLARRLGYADASAFGKAFRRSLGISPGRWAGR